MSFRLLTSQADLISPSSQRSSSIRTKVTKELKTGNDHSEPTLTWLSTKAWTVAQLLLLTNSDILTSPYTVKKVSCSSIKRIIKTESYTLRNPFFSMSLWFQLERLSCAGFVRPTLSLKSRMQCFSGTLKTCTTLKSDWRLNWGWTRSEPRPFTNTYWPLNKHWSTVCHQFPCLVSSQLSILNIGEMQVGRRTDIR